MVIEEFISTYADQELNKMNKLNERALEEEDGADVESLDHTPASRAYSRNKQTFQFLHSINLT